MANITEIDTQEIRWLARKIGNIADQVESLANSNVRSMKSSVNDELKGATADALKGALNDLSGDIVKVSNGLSKVQSALNSYARRIEQIDAQSSK